MTLNLSLQPRQLMGLCIALAALCLFTFIYSVTQWHADWALAHAPMPRASLANTEDSMRLIAGLPDAHVFGVSNARMPITSLELRVTGIVKMDNEDASKAYISISGQPSKIYRAGDELPYGVKIYEITPDTVILENNGNFEKLPLPREKLQFKPKYVKESM